MLEEHCGDPFGTASQHLIDSESTPPKIKAVFQSFQAGILKLHPCFVNRNVKCLQDILSNVGIAGTKEFVAESTGDLHELAKKMYDIDLIQYSKLEKLNPGDGIEANKILCDLLHKKTLLIYDFVEKHETPNA